MRTGVSYMGHHNPRHLATDCRDIRSLGCDDVLLAAQENDFVHMTGKVDFFPRIAKDNGLRPIAIFWGALNLFGGGRSSQFLLENPDCHQVLKDGGYNPAGCYVNPKSVARIQQMIDKISATGFEGYFVDEPTHIQCFCESCKRQFREWYGGDLMRSQEADIVDRESVFFKFRSRCVIDYITKISDHVKKNHPHIETMTCLMDCDRVMWEAASRIQSLDNLGTDIYWTNNDRDVEEMTPLVRDLASVCKTNRKKHHEWLQCWAVQKGREQRIIDQGDILIRENPDALYVWAYNAQIGTVEACGDVELAWSNACDVLRRAKQK